MKVTLVLGSLGLGSLANIGVLQVLSQEVSLKKIVATGVNALIVAHLGLGGGEDELLDRLIDFFHRNRGSLFGLERLGGLPRGSLLPSGLLRQGLFCRANLSRPSTLTWEAVEGLLQPFEGRGAEALPVPLAVAGIVLETGREVLLQRGPLAELIQVGLALPGVFPAVRSGGRSLVNSILHCELPLGPLTADDRPILAVDLSAPPGSRPRLRSLLEVTSRVDELRGLALKRALLPKADHLIRLKLPSMRLKRRELKRSISRAQEETAGAIKNAAYH